MAVFYDKQGYISSIRSTTRVGNSKVDHSTYFSSGKGGVTFRSNAMTTRMSNTGRTIGVGTGNSSKIYYNGRTSTANIPQFSRT